MSGGIGGSGSGGGIRGFFNKLRKPSECGTSNGFGQVTIGSRTMAIDDIQKLIPSLEKSNESQDRLLKKQQATMDEQVKRIADLETEVTKLQTECDKLRSVLQQKSGETFKRSDELSSSVGQRNKKLAVSAEPTTLDNQQITLEHFLKEPRSKHLIRGAVQKNNLLTKLAKEQILELTECMYEKRFFAGQWIIQEGQPGDCLYVSDEGEVEVLIEGIHRSVLGPGCVFGELAILYNCTRTASIRAIGNVRLWVLDRSVYQMITMRLGMQRQNQLMDFLKNVAIFRNLTDDRISKIADVLDQEVYDEGHYIIREGEKGDTFFVLNSGQVRVTQLIEGDSEPHEIRVLKQGDFFGEKALLGEEVRTASVVALAPGVEVLTLDRDSFLRLIGDLEALKKDYGDANRRALSSRSPSKSSTPLATTSRPAEPSSPAKTALDKEFVSLHLKDLKRLTTLGVGGFGRVELVCIGGDKTRTYALKALKKRHIVDTRQQEHIFAERNIMMETRSDWIVRLYTTFRDPKFVYMLLEVCLGGELWTTLRDHGHFEDYTARFFVACVLQALDFLHTRKIVYRDLKPENCLLANDGYLKVVDFGFAKKLPSGRKTWTFCGTPEYVAPEIILNKGHDQAADYWALGIYICELMLGRPPFQAADPMKTYTLILKGVDALEIPNRRIGKTATALVKKLCRDNPGERLGSTSGGINDIRKHRRKSIMQRKPSRMNNRPRTALRGYNIGLPPCA